MSRPEVFSSPVRPESCEARGRHARAQGMRSGTAGRRMCAGPSLLYQLPCRPPAGQAAPAIRSQLSAQLQHWAAQSIII